jgi:putative transposase
MPDHVHLLLSEPERSSLAEAIKALKQGVSRKLRTSDGRFWQTRYYDFNVHDEASTSKSCNTFTAIP